jgi:hypothetical protein
MDVIRFSVLDADVADCFGSMIMTGCHKVKSWKCPGRHHLQQWPLDRAMASTRAKLGDCTDRRWYVDRSKTS